MLYFILLCLLNPVLGQLSNNTLFNYLFDNYNITNRPVKNYDNTVHLNYGIEIYSLNYFNQKAERIEFNLLLTQLWQDEYLTWNQSIYNKRFIEINANKLWNPDIELYNSGEKPFLFSGDDSTVKIYSNGDVFWNKLITYSFSCSLNLVDFPFDTQECTLLFGSWKHNNATLDLKPFNDIHNFRNFTIYEKFSHNEWEIIDTSIKHTDVVYLCCPGEFYPNTEFSVKLKRKSMKYNIVMLFTAFITISGICVSFMNIKNYTRAFVLVFIPLSIIWLQIYIADKIPVIEYSTLIEKYLLTCFITTMCLSLESVGLFCLYSEDFLPKVFTNIKYDNLLNNKKIEAVIKNDKIIKYDKILNKFDSLFRTAIVISITIALLLIVYN
jgi:hypothetical protein